jgi:hypothetical protein
LVVNELSNISDEETAIAWTHNAAKLPDCGQIIGTNAGVLDSWQFRWREDCRQSPHWTFQKYARPAPWLDAADLTDAEKRDPRRFRSNFWGEWRSAAGSPLDEDDLLAAAAAGLRVRTTVGMQHFLGIDLAVSSDNIGMVVVAAGDQCVHAVHSETRALKPGEKKRHDLMEAQRTVYSLSVRYKATVIIDPYQAALFTAQLIAMNVSCVEVPFTPANCTLMANRLLTLFSERRITLCNDPHLLASLRQASIVEKTWGWKIEGKRGARGSGHADSAIALALAAVPAIDVAMATVEEIPYHPLNYMSCLPTI